MNEKFKELREQAETILKNNLSQNSDIPASEFQKIIHDLQVYQIELELQNEELRNTQTQLETSKNNYAELYNQSPAGYVTLNQNSIILQANQTFMDMVGKDSSKVLNISFSEFLDPEDRSIFLARFHAFFRNPTEKYIELKLEGKGGKIIYVRMAGNLLVENNITPKKESATPKLFLIINDITSEKKVEETLLESNTRLTLGMRVANMAWWEMDIATGNVTIDKKKAEMLGYPPERFKHYKDFTDLIHPDDHTKAMNALLEHISGQVDRYEVEYRILAKSGEYKWFLDIGSIMKWNASGKPLIIIGLVQNITDRKIAENNLIELNATKDKFFSILAHDLRGPIGSLHSSFEYLSNIDENTKVEKFNRFLPLLKNSAKSILTLLENLLVWARSQKGDIPYNPSKHNLNNIIHSNIQLFLATAKGKNVKLTTQLEQEFYSFFDVDMITTVLRNLISNALKFTNENDSIQISVHTLENKLEVRVEDSGIGMQQSTLETLFRIDVRHQSNAGTNGEKGTGLGLILCKEFLDKHNEKISATSELGKGSIFIFTLPNLTESS